MEGKRPKFNLIQKIKMHSPYPNRLPQHKYHPYFIPYLLRICKRKCLKRRKELLGIEITFPSKRVWKS